MPSPRRKTTVFAVPRSTARSVPAAKEGNLTPRTVAALAAREAEVEERSGVAVHVGGVEHDGNELPAVPRGGGDEAPAGGVRVARLHAVRAPVLVEEEVVVEVDLRVRRRNPP